MISYHRIVQYLQDDLWTHDEERMKPSSRFLLQALRRLVITIECFIQNNLTSYAAALTYSSLLAAVPVLSIIFAIARGFGFDAQIEDFLRESVQVDGQISDTVLEFIDRYLEHTHSGVFLGVGLILLFFTVVMLTSNIETAFNTIWHVRSSRNIYRQIVEYASVFLFLPLLIVVTSGVSVYLLTIADDWAEYRLISGTMQFVIQYAPVIMSCLCFVALYKMMPNTEVRWCSVLFPGFLAGILFQMLQFLYIHYQLLLSGYNAIYGSFAALPLFMLWMQFSWYICLGGAQMSYAIQRSDEYLFAKDCEQLPRIDHDALCIYVMSFICRRFTTGKEGYDVHRLSKETRLPHSIIQGLVEELVYIKLLSEVPSETGNHTTYQPRLDIRCITPNFVIQQLDSNGKGHLSSSWEKGNATWINIRRIRNKFTSKDGDKPVAELNR